MCGGSAVLILSDIRHCEAVEIAERYIRATAQTRLPLKLSTVLQGVPRRPNDLLIFLTFSASVIFLRRGLQFSAFLVGMQSTSSKGLLKCILDRGPRPISSGDSTCWPTNMYLFNILDVGVYKESS